MHLIDNFATNFSSRWLILACAQFGPTGRHLLVAGRKNQHTPFKQLMFQEFTSNCFWCRFASLGLCSAL
jgi:hypothetical protein